MEIKFLLFTIFSLFALCGSIKSQPEGQKGGSYSRGSSSGRGSSNTGLGKERPPSPPGLTKSGGSRLPTRPLAQVPAVRRPNTINHMPPSIEPRRETDININIPNVVPQQPGPTIVMDSGTHNGAGHRPVHQPERQNRRNSGSPRFLPSSSGFNLQHVAVILVVLFSATLNP